MPIPAQALPHRHPFRNWLGLAVLMLPVLLVTVDNTILGFALPRIAEALRPSASQQLWMIDAYSLILAGLLVSMGSLGDRLGHRKLLLIGALGFTVVSVLTAYSQTAAQLIAGRTGMGVFGAMLMPSTLALIRSLFEDREQRRLAVAIWATTLTVGSALGPLIGGVYCHSSTGKQSSCWLSQSWCPCWCWDPVYCQSQIQSQAGGLIP